MFNDNDGGSCARNCFFKGAITGLFFALIFFVFVDFGLLKALFWGIVIAIIVALVLGYFICGKANNAPGGSGTSTGSGASSSSPTPVPASAADTASAASDTATPEASAPAEAAPEAAVESAPVASAAASTPVKAFEMQPSTPLAGEAELAARKGVWKYEAEPAPKAAPAKKKPAAAKKAAAKTDAAPAKAAKAKRAPVAADGQPETLTGPRDGQTSDDLKLIGGVGPKLEQTLNELGFYHFDQVAGWRKKEIEWVDSRLRFKGRIERDDWVSQAKILAKGGETEFSKRKKK